MDVDMDKENFPPHYRGDNDDGMLQGFNEINDMVSGSSDSVNDSDESDKNEINIKGKIHTFVFTQKCGNA